MTRLVQLAFVLAALTAVACGRGEQAPRPPLPRPLAVVEPVPIDGLAPDTLTRAWAQGMRPRERLDDNDGHGFFEALGDSVITGPTLTNVNDFRAIVIDGSSTGA